MTDDFETKVSYALGVASIILAFVNIFGGLVAGIVGFNIIKKQNIPLAKKARKLNKTGIIINVIILIIIIVLFLLGLFSNILNTSNFPIA